MVNRLHRFEELEGDVIEARLLFRGEGIEIFETGTPEPANLRIFGERSGDFPKRGGGGVLRRELRDAGAAMHLHGQVPERGHDRDGTDELRRGIDGLPVHAAVITQSRPKLLLAGTTAGKMVASAAGGMASRCTVKDRHEEIMSALPTDLDALPRLGGFRLRGLEMTRLETFIDAAFAFAVTMMVIAGDQVPDKIEELLAAFKNVPAFIGCIVVLGIFWRGHWLWSRRYGLEDGVSIFVSWALIATVLIYIYPLKAIFGSMWYLLSDGRIGKRWACARKRKRGDFLGLCNRIYRDGVRDPAAVFARLAVARGVALKYCGASNDARGSRGMGNPRERGITLARAGVDPADPADRVERLGLFFDGAAGAAALPFPQAPGPNSEELGSCNRPARVNGNGRLPCIRE